MVGEAKRIYCFVFKAMTIAKVVYTNDGCLEENRHKWKKKKKNMLETWVGLVGKFLNSFLCP